MSGEHFHGAAYLTPTTNRQLRGSVTITHVASFYKNRHTASPRANNESSEVIDILLPVNFYFNPSTRLDNVKNLITIRYYQPARL